MPEKKSYPVIDEGVYQAVIADVESGRQKPYDLRFDAAAPEPGELSEVLMHLSADYAHKAADFTAVLGKNADAWQKMRKKRGSDKQADKAWDATMGAC